MLPSLGSAGLVLAGLAKWRSDKSDSGFRRNNSIFRYKAYFKGTPSGLPTVKNSNTSVPTKIDRVIPDRGQFAEEP